MAAAVVAATAVAAVAVAAAPTAVAAVAAAAVVVATAAAVVAAVVVAAATAVVVAAVAAATVVAAVAAARATEPARSRIRKAPAGAFCFGAAEADAVLEGERRRARGFARRRDAERGPYSPRRFLRPRPASSLSNSGFGSRRISLATTPICHGMTR
jgi:hypothetical protein